MAIGFVLITTEPGQEKMVRETLESIDLVTAGWMSVSYTHLRAHET